MTFSSLKLLLILVFCVILPERLDSTRRNFAVLTGGARRLLSSAGTALIIGWQVGNPILVHAYGPTDVEIKIKSYQQVELCNGQKPIMPGQKAAEGLFPVCIEVSADVVNPDKTKVLTDVSVYGFVKEDDAGNSVLPNNPDFKSDSGQYAMIKEISPGTSTIKYQFVAAVSADPKKSPLPQLTFFKTKARSFPGGEKFKPLGECEIDPRADGCSPELDED
eukprot:gene24499-31902_t